MGFLYLQISWTSGCEMRLRKNFEGSPVRWEHLEVIQVRPHVKQCENTKSGKIANGFNGGSTCIHDFASKTLILHIDLYFILNFSALQYLPNYIK